MDDKTRSKNLTAKSNQRKATSQVAPQTISQLRNQVIASNPPKPSLEHVIPETTTPGAPQPVIKERIIEKTIIREQPERKKGRGCFLFNCRQILTCGCLLPILLVFLCGALLYFRPTILWEPAKNFLNAELNNTNFVKLSSVPQSISFADKVKVATNTMTLELDQNELAAILQPILQSQDNIYLALQEDQLLLLINLDKSGNPLWVRLQFSLYNNRLQLNKMGFGRLDIPEGLRKSLETSLMDTFGAFNIADVPELLNTTLSNLNVKVDSVKLVNGKVQLQLKQINSAL